MQDRTLSPEDAQAYYDRFGAKQDSQGFYERPAVDDLIAHANFEDACRVFEFGCGTGKLARRLLEDHLPASATYVGCDVSSVMVELAKSRLEGQDARATVVLSDGAVRFPVPDESVDRVVSCYVLDLLAKTDIEQFFSEARRVVVPGGRVCIASLTRGINLRSRIVAFLWTRVFRSRPSMVGGCRPIRADAFVDPRQWRIVHQRVVTPFGVPSEVTVLEPHVTRRD